MADLYGFNAHEVEPSTSMEPVPAGKYEVIVTDSEMKATKSGSGEYLQLTFEITAGEFKGRLLWSRLNLVNSNETAVRIARQELSAICRAIGVMEPRDSQDLHQLPLVVDVRCRKRKDNDELTNEIKKYHAPQSALPVASASTNGSKPWKRG